MIDVTVIACIWPWWGYLYHGYWQTLHLGSPSTPPPHLGDPRVPHLPPHNCMCKSVLHEENCSVLALYRCICLWIHIRITWGTWPTRQLPAWIPLSTMISGNFVKRLLEVMQVRDEGMKHRKEEHSYERNAEVEWRSFVIDSDSFPLHHFPACNHRLIFVIP